jgi:hypothetical protein
VSSPPSDRTLEGLIEDNWDEVVARDPRVVALLEPYRDTLEYLADDFDEESQSWRDCRSAIWDTVPEDIRRRVREVAAEPPTGVQEFVRAAGPTTRVIGIKPVDEKFHKMLAAYRACKAAGVPVPEEVTCFFDDLPPEPDGVRVDVDGTPAVVSWRSGDGTREGYEVDLRLLDPDIKLLRVYNSY